MAQKRSETECKMNMTPMIDVVFQLLIFFILVTELQNKDYVQLTLPRADQAKAEEDIPKGRMTISITKDGEIMVMAKTYSLKKLSERLRVEADLTREAGTEFSDKPILIRADHKTEYKSVSDVMEQCIKHNIWKLSFAALRAEDLPPGYE